MRKRINIFLICIMLVTSYIIVFFPIETVKASGNTLYVGGSGPGNYTKIQDAIDASSDGDTVFVYNGTYYENIFIDKTINLIGENRDKTIIDANKIDDVIHVISNNIIINGFTIINSGNTYDPDNILNSDSGVDIQSNNVNISNNIIANNYIGLSTRGSSSKEGLVIYNNIFINNSKDGKQFTQSIDFYACYLMYTDHSNIYNNEFFRNDNGIHLAYSDYNRIIGNQIINTTNDGPNIEAICLKESDFNFVSNNYIKNTKLGVGIWLYSLTNLAEGNIINNNTIEETYRAITMQFCTENRISENLIICNNYSITVYFDYNNLFYHNDFINNADYVYDNMSNNWYNASIKEGNFWDDYTGEDIDQNGVGDTPYNISGGSNQDMYPLMKPWNNIAPEKPTIDGPKKGRINKEQDYQICSTDLNNDDLYYIVDWGDKKLEEFGPYHSGEDFLASHIWETENTYLIKVKSKDKYNAESNWATLEVTMPKNKAINTSLFLPRFFQRFPFFEKILKQYYND